MNERMNRFNKNNNNKNANIFMRGVKILIIRFVTQILVGLFF